MEKKKHTTFYNNKEQKQGTNKLTKCSMDTKSNDDYVGDDFDHCDDIMVLVQR